MTEQIQEIQEQEQEQVQEIQEQEQEEIAVTKERSIEEIRAAVAENVRRLNAAYRENRSVKDIEDIKEFLDADCEAYTAKKRAATYNHLVSVGGNIMLNAISQKEFETISYGLNTKKTEFIVKYNKKVQIDVLDLHEYVRDNFPDVGFIGKNKDWDLYLQRYNKLLVLKAAEKHCSPEKLEAEIKSIDDSYSMQQAARELIDERFERVKNGEEGGAVVSKSRLIKLLKEVVGMMLGEKYAERVKSFDYEYLVGGYTSHGKKNLKVKCASHEALRGDVQRVLYRIATNGDYKLVYPHES